MYHTVEERYTSKVEHEYKCNQAFFGRNAVLTVKDSGESAERDSNESTLVASCSGVDNRFNTVNICFLDFLFTLLLQPLSVSTTTRLSFAPELIFLWLIFTWQKRMKIIRTDNLTKLLTKVIIIILQQYTSVYDCKRPL